MVWRRRGKERVAVGRRRVRRAAWVPLVLLVLAVPLTLLAVQTWNIVAAIAEVQDVAVVPLPDDSSSRPILGGDPYPEASRSGADGGASRDPRSPVEPGGDGGSLAAPAARSHERAATASPEGVGGGSTALSDWDVARTIAAAATQGGDPLDADVWDGKRALTVLVLGIDRRAEGGDQNADTIILARLDLTTGRVRAVSIPRDLLVEIPGVGEGKINGAYDAGVRAGPDDPVAGVVAMRDTVEAVFGVAIDHYVLVDFAGFESVIDAVGGIDVTVPVAIRDDAYPTEDYGTRVVEFEAGRQHMDGERALQYARIRNPDSDDQRRERQFQVLVALLEKGQRLGSITQAAETIVALGGAAQTSLTLEEQLTLARIAMTMDTSAVSHVALGPPDVTPGWTEDGAWVYRGDPAAIRVFVRSALGLG